VDGGQRRVSLPDLFALLEEDRVAGFPRLLPHQRHAWHAFLVQIACLVLENESLPVLGEGPCLLGLHDAEWWGGSLRRLTPGFARDEPWTLVVEDLAKPAFFQPPVTDGPLKNWTGSKESPDELDVLVTSKNHGVKQVRMNTPEAEDWLFALVSAQTQGGYAGPGLYGIARQNGGYGTRTGFSFVSGMTPGGQWARDARIILEKLNNLAPAIFTNPRRALLWLEPWDGRTSWPLADLHPLFVEICRRIRLIPRGRDLLALYTSTKGARLAAKDFNGVVGDPWIPVHVAAGKAFGGLPTYRNLSRMLGKGEYTCPLLMQAHPCDPPTGMAAQCRILLRGQGKTAGYWERLIPIPGSSLSWSRDITGDLAGKMVSLAEKAERNVLAPALKLFLAGGANGDSGAGGGASRGGDGLSACVNALDRDVDEAFFPLLWKMLEQRELTGSDSEAEQLWSDELRRLAEKNFEASLDALPGVAASCLRARTEADLLFRKLLNRILPRAEKTEDKEDTCTAHAEQDHS
jgi:CRISPR system Cascade subunit CasA